MSLYLQNMASQLWCIQTSLLCIGRHLPMLVVYNNIARCKYLCAQRGGLSYHFIDKLLPFHFSLFIIKTHMLYFSHTGTIGDWRNHFTVAQNELFDRLYNEKMADSRLVFDFGP